MLCGEAELVTDGVKGEREAEVHGGSYHSPLEWDGVWQPGV